MASLQVQGDNEWRAPWLCYHIHGQGVKGIRKIRNMNDHSVDGLKDIGVKPVGFVKTTLKEPMPVPRDSGAVTEGYMKELREYRRRVKELESELVIFPELQDTLEGIEDFSHIMVLYWAHLIPEHRKGTLQVHPMGRKDMPQKGIFATCSPVRPNSILLSPVRLISRKGNVLVVRGLEALDGTPILDIKPYIKDYHCIEEASMPEWMKRLREETI